jgi:prepilin-type processing-associated H-X9-DG protein
MITVYETAGNHGADGRNVLFLDTHVVWMTEEQFREAIEKDNEYRREKGLPVLPIK